MQQFQDNIMRNTELINDIAKKLTERIIELEKRVQELENKLEIKPNSINLQ